MKSPLDQLAEARLLLQGGLALFDQADLDDASIPDALMRLTAALEAQPDPLTLRSQVAEADLEAFDDEVEELVKLNAVLVTVASNDREALVSTLSKARAARKGTAYYGRSGGEGGRCDMTG